MDRQGWTSAAARVAGDPGALGELRGRTGFFAGRAARAERERAVGLAPVVVKAMGRVGAAEARVAGAHRATVAAQLKADATGVPRLSAKAEAAVAAMAEAKDNTGRAAALKAVRADPAVAGELRRFEAAARARLGGGSGRGAAHPPTSVESRRALERVRTLTTALRTSEGATARHAAKSGGAGLKA